MLGRTYTYIDI